MIRQTSDQYRWKGVDLLPYKEDGGTHFKSISRQTLFQGSNDLPVEMRYFEMATDGHSTLERHHHQHAVMIIRGSGQVFVGDTITPINTHDVVHIPPFTWHQFRATNGEELGFLCVVSMERDKPQRPTSENLEVLGQIPGVAEFIRV
ncbi:MAG: cupin domain-containing protein [Armatimonadota bacterium]